MKSLKTCLAVMLAVTQITQSAQAGFFDNLFKKNPPQPAPVQKPVPQNLGMPTIKSTGRYAHLAPWGIWRIVSTRWTYQDEMGFSDFVRAIGRSDCRTIESCIMSEDNPFYGSDPGPELYQFWSDCADWPYFLRSYYAWKSGLPFMFSANMQPLPLTPEQQQAIDEGKSKDHDDVRYSLNGNRPTKQIRVPDPFNGSNFFEVQEIVQNSIATSTLRVDPRTNLGDTYTPEIQPGSIRPGTLVYDPSGHTGVVYDVTHDGQVMVFDAYSDKKSVSVRRPYSSDYYKRSRISHGGWFQNFRPLVIEGAQFDPRTNSYVGGTMRALTNEEIPDFSLEMFGNTTTPDGKSAYLIETENGPLVTNSFQEFLRRRLYLLGEFKLDVVSEFRNKMKAVCDDFTARGATVQNATKNGIASQPHADVLPDTIYGGADVWEVYSTPGGDVRRRSTVTTALNEAKLLKNMIATQNKDYVYRGSNLKADFINIAKETLRTCSVTYTNTAGQNVKLSLEEMLRRTPLMSFSPWHCIELRWGATSPEELRSCPDLNDPIKMRWYRAQQPLRNQVDRDTTIFTGYTLEELEQNASKVGPAKPQNLNLIERFEAEL